MFSPSPVFAKETTQLASGRGLWLSKAAVVTALWLAGLALGLLDAQAPADPAVIGRLAFQGLALGLLAAILVLAPLLTAGAVCGEREANTLGLLFLTRLTPAQIVQDKGLARLAALALVVFAAAPLLYGCLLLGGVEALQVLNLVGTLAGAALMAGGVSLWASTYERSYLTALGRAYLYLALWLTLGTALLTLPLLMCCVPIGETFGNRIFGGALLGWLLSAANPILALSLGMMAPNYALFNWNWVASLAGGWCCYRWALHHAVLNVTAVQQVDSQPATQLVPPLLAGLPGTPAPMTREALRSWLGDRLARAPRPGRWPMAWKEAAGRQQPLKQGAAKLALPLAFIHAVAILLLALGGSHGETAELQLWVAPTVLLVPALVLVALFSVSGLSTERQQQTLEILLTTRLSGAQILAGHLLELAKYAGIYVVPAFAVTCTYAALMWHHVGRVLAWYGQAAGLLLLVAAVGLLCAVIAPRPARAIAYFLPAIAVVWVLLAWGGWGAGLALLVLLYTLLFTAFNRLAGRR